MAPKTKKGAKGGSKDVALKEKIRKKRAKMPEAYPAQTIAELQCKRARFIATQVGVKNSSKFSFPSELVPKIVEKMSLNLDCDECNGACQPKSHVFPAVESSSPNPADDEEVEEDENVEEEEEVIDGESGGELSDAEGSLGADDSPQRSVIASLGSLDNPLDIRVPAAAGNIPFTDHVCTRNRDSGSGKVLPAPGQAIHFQGCGQGSLF